MQNKHQKRRVLSLFMAFIMMLTVLPIKPLVAAVETIASWEWKAYPEFPAQATGGRTTSAMLTYTNAANNTATTYTTSNKSIAVNQWHSGEEYWLITLPKEGYSKLALSFDTFSSGTGPKEFKVQVSTDNVNFVDVANGNYENGSSHNAALTKENLSISTPEVDRADVVYIRFQNTSTVSVNNGTIAGTGTSRLYNVSITGVKDESSGETDNEPLQVKASVPNESTVEVGTDVTFTTTTSAALYVTLNEGGSYSSYDTYTLTLNEGAFVDGKAQVTVYAENDEERTAEIVYTYYQKEEIPSEVVSIAEARKASSGTVVTIEGTVTRTFQASGTSTGNSTIYIQDDTAGIAMYKSNSFTLESYAPGTKLKVTGKISAYNGVIQIQPEQLSDIQDMGSSTAGVTPHVITIEELNSTAYEGKLVKVVGVKLDQVATNSNHIIKDLYTEQTATMRCTGGTTLENFKADDVIDVVGVSANFKGDAQLMVSTEVDVTKGQEAPVAVVTATPGTGNQVPLNVEITLATATEGATISYTLNGEAAQTIAASEGVVTISEFDTEGKAVLTATATKEGYTTPEVTFVYTQAKVEKVASSMQSGSINGDTEIKLTTGTPDAAITYQVTTHAGEVNEEVGAVTVYEGAITLTEEMLPVKIEAWATAKNYLDSDVAEFNYRLKSEAGDMQNYFGQLHAHTTNSDGAGTLEEAFTWARDAADLDFFAVTDHSNSYDTANTSDIAGTYNLGEYNKNNEKWQNGVQAAEAARTEDYISVYGYEMTWSGGPGHINTFGTEGFVSRNNKELNNKTNDAGLRAYYELLKDTPESISQFNHPGKTFGTFSGYAYYDPSIDARISLIEVGNGEGAVGSNGYYPSYEEYTAALDKGWHLAPTNNQDNHKKGWGTSNTARTVIYTDDLSVDGLYDALRERRVYATEDNNLDIVYTLNDEVLGSILGDVPETAEFKVNIQDLDDTDAIKSVSIITNGGKVVHSETYNEQNVAFNYTLNNPKAGYYYIKVVQADGHIAVTAPVWLGEAAVVGIASVEASVSMPVTDEAFTLTTEVFNNEKEAVTLESISYDFKEGGTIDSIVVNESLKANSNYTHTQQMTVTSEGEKTVVVKAVMEVNGEAVTYTAELVLDVRDAEKLTYVGIDASHHNEYVNGNYKDSMGNFGKLAEGYDVRTVELYTSEELLAALENPKYEMMVFTAPSRRNGTTGRLPYDTYSDKEIEAITEFAAQGKTVIIAGWADYYENYSNLSDMPVEEHMAAQQNKLLEAIGASLRISDDEILDDINNGGQSPRLYLTDYNHFVNPLTNGIVEGQVYSNYGGASIYAVNENGALAATLPESVSPIISGHETTYSADKDGDGFGLADKTQKIPTYNDRTLVTASETVTHDNGNTSQVIVSGAAFMSNFEIQAEVDNAGSLNYSNYNILENIIKTIAGEVEITPISEVKKAPEGTVFTIEGIVTSGIYDGSEDNKGFFDCIYVQDATGGINVFPVGEGVAVGQKVRLKGTVSSYQGEVQLNVAGRKVEVIDTESHEVHPELMTAAEAMSPEHTGKLVQVTGVVEEVISEGGVVNQIMIQDGTGSARIYINAYITNQVNLGFVKEGATISVVGLASVGENFSSEEDFLPRLRVRDRGEIKLIETGTEEPVPSSQANLSTLTVNYGTLYPVFNTETLVYSVSVGNSMTKITIDAVATDPKATVEGLGEKLLNVGKNIFEIKVTAEDGITVKTYVVTVTRASSASDDDDEMPSTSQETASAEIAIKGLTAGEKQAIINNMSKANQETRPYTVLNKDVISRLDTLTNGKFTKKQLEEMLEKPELLKGLGINLEAVMSVVTLEAKDKVAFIDVKQTHWANESIQQAAALGLVAGRPDGTFAPGEALKVADTFTFLDRVLLLNDVTKMKLPRSTVEKYVTNQSHWAFASTASVASKLTESTLKEITKLGEGELSRELLAQVIYEVTNGKLKEVVKVAPFSDLVASPYETALMYCAKAGVLNGMGDGTMAPQKALTRAELMTVLVRLNEKMA